MVQHPQGKTIGFLARMPEYIASQKQVEYIEQEKSKILLGENYISFKHEVASLLLPIQPVAVVYCSWKPGVRAI